MDGVLRWRRDGDWGWRGGAVTATERAVSTRLDRALRRLESLAAASDFRESETDRSLLLRCELRPSASLDALDEAELQIGAALPADYRRFLLRSDGAVLTSTETPVESLELLGTGELVRHAEAAAAHYADGCIPETMLFATIGERGDGLAFDLTRLNPYGGCGVLDARCGYRPDQWWTIACDFTSWLHAMLRETGPAGSFGRDWTQGPEQLPLPFGDGPASWLDGL
jgi:hypothetical protein